MLIWGLSFGEDEIIWVLKFRGPKCAICGLKFGVGKIIWGPIFPAVIVQAIFFQNWTADYLGSLKKLVWLVGDLRKLLEITPPLQKCPLGEQ